MSAPLPTLQQWAKELAQRQMPIFARTARTIADQADDAERSASDLAAQVLQDVSMTTRLLRMANSSHFNPHSGKINTVSRAIILLGFNVVRDLCLSISLIDTCLSGKNQESVAEEMALAFHAALQARRLAEITRQRDPEEIFIATLLSHLGDLAFLCFADGVADEVRNRLLEARKLELSRKDEVERSVLGFPIRELTALLNREWRLSPLLNAALDPSAAKTDRTQLLQLGNELAVAMVAGPNNPPLEALLQRIAKRLDLDLDELRRQVWRTAQSATETMTQLGAPAAARCVPRSTAATDSGGRAESSAAASAEPGIHWNPGDAPLQLAMLRELSQLLVETRPSVGVLMDLVLEGVFRGVGFDRAVFALLAPDRSTLRAKACLFSEGAALPEPFEFRVGKGESNPFELTLRSGEPLWLGSPRGPATGVDARTQKLCGGRCFIMPLWVGSTAIGCIYADRAASQRELSDDLYTQFKLFGQQARLGLTFIKSR